MRIGQPHMEWNDAGFYSKADEKEGEQAVLLKRYSPSVTLLYDSDAAGLRATFRAGDVLLASSLRVSVATLPPGEDPDTLAAKGGAKAIRAVLDDAIDVLERKIQLLDRKGWLASLSGRRKALDRLLPTLRAAADPVTRDQYVARVSEVLSVSPQSIAREIEMSAGLAPRRAVPGYVPEASAGQGEARPRRGGLGPERELVRVMVHRPDWRGRVIEQIGDLPAIREPERQLIALLGATPDSIAVQELLSSVDGEARVLLADTLAEPWGAEDVDAIVVTAISKLQGRSLEAEYRDVTRQIPLASQENQQALFNRAAELSREKTRLNPVWNVIRKGG